MQKAVDSLIIDDTGNSKALIEEERFRRHGKRKYETLAEKIIQVMSQVHRMSKSLSIPIDLGELSSATSHVLKGNNCQELTELMHLHTMTHGAKRWSGDKDVLSLEEPLTVQRSSSSEAPRLISNAQASASSTKLPQRASGKLSGAAAGSALSNRPLSAAGTAACQGSNSSKGKIPVAAKAGGQKVIGSGKTSVASQSQADKVVVAATADENVDAQNALSFLINNI